jgi:hypothetical protein
VCLCVANSPCFLSVADGTHLQPPPSVAQGRSTARFAAPADIRPPLTACGVPELYRMIQSGNMVNVTSLFCLVPVVTVVLDYGLLGNALPGASHAGHGGHLLGLVFRTRQ